MMILSMFEQCFFFDLVNKDFLNETSQIYREQRVIYYVQRSQHSYWSRSWVICPWCVWKQDSYLQLSKCMEDSKSLCLNLKITYTSKIRQKPRITYCFQGSHLRSLHVIELSSVEVFGVYVIRFVVDDSLKSSMV